MALNVGAITKIVRKIAMPTSTWLGGLVGVPRPERMKPRTMRMRVKPVTQNSSAGISVMAAISRSNWTAPPPSPLPPPPAPPPRSIWASTECAVFT